MTLPVRRTAVCFSLMKVLGVVGVSAVLVLGLGVASSSSADAPAKKASRNKAPGRKPTAAGSAQPKKTSGTKPPKKTKKTNKKKKRKAKVPTARRSNKGRKAKRSSAPISPIVRKALGKKKHKPVAKFDACSSEVPQAPPGMDAAVLETAYAWPNGSTLRIGFVDGSYEARKAVRDMALRWTEHANLQFEFVLSGPAEDLDIRIQFAASACNSNVGTSSRYAAGWGDVTMNLCNKDREIGSDRFQRVVLHEFGHALGLRHEHRNPKVKFNWNYDYVYNYYASYSGWDRARVDRNVFNPLEPSEVLVSEHDPDSVMHYTFPPEFTVDRRAMGGKNTISPMDAKKIAEWYPQARKDNVKTYERRKVAVWNRTTKPITVKVVYEAKKKSGSWFWSPSSNPTKGKTLKLGPGKKKFVPKAYGRRAKLIATNGSGDKWTLDEPLAKSYEARKMETHILEVEGAPDTPPSKSPDALFSSANKALEDGKYKLARKRFRAFTKRYPKDSRMPWARFYIVAAWYEAGNYNRSVNTAFNLITDLPESAASDFAWYYGGAASFELGQCENSEAFFKFVADPDYGLPQELRDGAEIYLGLIENHSAKYCR